MKRGKYFSLSSTQPSESRFRACLVQIISLNNSIRLLHEACNMLQDKSFFQGWQQESTPLAELLHRVQMRTSAGSAFDK